MTLDQVQQLPVVECLSFRHGKPGFALPLLAHPERKELRVVQEVDEYTNLIRGFKILSDYTPAAAIKIDGPLATTGRELIHVFFTEDLIAHVGELADLHEILREFALRCPSQHAVILQIRELIGTDQEKKIARLVMRETVAKSVGANAATAFYEGDVLRSALWLRLLKAALMRNSQRE